MGALLILLLLHQTLPVLWVAPGLTPCSMQDLSHSHLSGHGSGQAKPKPGQSRRLWLGLRIPEAKATQSQAKASGFQAKPSQNITTPDGTMVSLVMQIGDCNASATYQSLMNHIFSDFIGVFMDVYLDDIVIYSDSAEEHVKHVRQVVDRLRE